MSTIIKISNIEGNKYYGFSLSKIENLNSIFKYELQIGSEFNIGTFNYKIHNIIIEGFFNSNINTETLDEAIVKLGTTIILCCTSNDPRMELELQNFEDLKKYLS